MSGTTNRGVVGYISNPVASFPANSITVDIFGNAFYRNYAFGAGDDTGVYWNDEKEYSEAALMFMSVAIETSLKRKFSYGHKLRSSQSLDLQIQLPITEKGDINFDFIEELVRELERERLFELERERLFELEAYLEVTGLKDYTLTEEEKNTLDKFNRLKWQAFNVKDLFGDSTRGKRLKSEDRIPGTLPFVTAGEVNTGISDFIGNGVTVFSSNTTTIDMFGSAKYRNYEYGADDHVAVVHTEKLKQKSAIFVTSACHKAAHTGKFNYGHNFYAKDADELYIMLPVCEDTGLPDYAVMEQIVSAVQKIVIADVAEITVRDIETTRQIISK